MKPSSRFAAACALLLAFTTAYGEPAGMEVLALFKSSEGQSAAENEVFYHCSIPLRELGLTVKYWDMDAGIPDAMIMKNVRAVLSWFRGPAMKNAEDYLTFLSDTLDRGKKVIVLDNFGAYQNRDTGKYLEPNRINLILARLGLLYAGDWTQDGTLLSVSKKDPEMTEAGGRQDPVESAFFYRFIPVDKDLAVHLAVSRKDRDYGSSPVIVTNRNGGFALSRYIYRVRGNSLEMLLNMKKFLFAALFPKAAEERVALIMDATHPAAAQILFYTTSVLTRSKIPFETIEIAGLSAWLPEDLLKFTTLCLITGTDDGIPAGLIEKYVASGGSLVSLMAGRFARLAPVLQAVHREIPAQHQTGFRFRYGFVLGEGLAPDDAAFEWFSGTLSPVKGTREIASNREGTVSMGWQSSDGRILVWNWDGFHTGDYSGLILESFLAVRPAGVAANPGLGLMFLDDWPLPMFNAVKAPNAMTDTRFYRDVWWKDMKDLFVKFKIPYNAYIIFNYNMTVSPPFSGGEFFVADGLASLETAREILASGNELGLHGYNHMSLTVAPTSTNEASWPSVKAMEQMLEAAREEWSRLFGERTLPLAYVAPNNIISDDGIRALKKVFPTMKIVSVHHAQVGEETVSRLGPHPEIPDIYYIPRTSSGYIYNHDTTGAIASSVSGLGMVSHFVHPDDVYDPARSLGKDWKALKTDFEKTLTFVRTHYPWVRFVPIREALSVFRTYDEAGLAVSWQGNGRLLVETNPGIQFRVRTNGRQIASISGASTVYRYQSADSVILRADGPVVEIRFR